MPVDLAEAVAEVSRGVVRASSFAETAARAEVAGTSVNALRDLGRLLSPYARGESSELRDIILTNRRGGLPNDAAAADRLREHAAATALTRAIQNNTTADFPGVVGAISLFASGHPAVGSPILDTLGTDYTGPTGRKFEAASWADLPEVSVDVAEKTEIGSAPLTTDIVEDGWHVAATAINQSQQSLDWLSADALADFDAMLKGAVSAGLERKLLGDVLTAATVSTDITAARVDAAAWPFAPADIVIAASADVPAVEGYYSALGQWPMPIRLVGTPNMTPGVVIVMPTSGVRFIAQPVRVLDADDPSLLGKEVAVMRAGAAVVRSAVAVRKVTLT